MSLRVGIIGTGWGVRVQIPLFRKAGLIITAIYSRDLQNAQKLATKHKIPNAFDSVEKLCESSEVDIISVTSPTFLHKEHALCVIQSGKHLLLDKPLTASFQEAIQLDQKVKLSLNSPIFYQPTNSRPEKLLLIDHELRLLESVVELRKTIQENTLGVISHIDAKFFLDMKGLGKKLSWWHEKGKGGGLLGALGVHIVDLLHFVSGEKLESLSAKTGIIDPYRELNGKAAEIQTEEWFVLNGETKSIGHNNNNNLEKNNKKVFVSVVSNSCVLSDEERKVVVVGNEGSAILDLDKGSLKVVLKSGKVVKTIQEKRLTPSPFSEGTIYLGEALAHFAQTNSTEKLNNMCTLKDSVYNQKVIELVRYSQGSWVNVNDTSLNSRL